MEILLSICIGIGLSAACGFRIFVPLLVVSIAMRAGYCKVSEGFAWLANDAALITFAVATILEILAYYIPWLDNLLDTIAMPVAVVAGVIIMASSLGNLSPYLKWTLSLIAGGGAACSIQFLTSRARVLSTGLTGGITNPILSTAELLTSLILSILSIILPLLAIFFIVIIFLLIIRGLRKKRFNC